MLSKFFSCLKQRASTSSSGLDPNTLGYGRGLCSYKELRGKADRYLPEIMRHIAAALRVPLSAVQTTSLFEDKNKSVDLRVKHYLIHVRIRFSRFEPDVFTLTTLEQSGQAAELTRVIYERAETNTNRERLLFYAWVRNGALYCWRLVTLRPLQNAHLLGTTIRNLIDGGSLYVEIPWNVLGPSAIIAEDWPVEEMQNAA